MKLLILDYNPEMAAEYLSDRDIKIHLSSVLSIAEILYDRETKMLSEMFDDNILWVKQSKQNWLWLLEFAEALNNEFIYRFGEDLYIDEGLKEHPGYTEFKRLVTGRTNDFPDLGLQPLPDAELFEDIIEHNRRVASSQRYEYTKRKAPKWFKDYK